MFRLIVFLSLALLAKSQDEGGCTLPSEWEGSWFEKGVSEPIAVTSDAISHIGSCRRYQYSPNTFVHRLIVEENESCFRLLVVNALISRVTNVLSYVKSNCSATMEDVISIGVEPTEHFMFRRNANTTCPITTTVSFFHSQECQDADIPSTVEPVENGAKLRFNISACSNNGWDTVQKIECVATFKRSGSTYDARYNVYVVGKPVGSNDVFRCYKVNSPGAYYAPFHLLISKAEDSMCDGLTSPLRLKMGRGMSKRQVEDVFQGLVDATAAAAPSA